MYAYVAEPNYRMVAWMTIIRLHIYILNGFKKKLNNTSTFMDLQSWTSIVPQASKLRDTLATLLHS